MHRSSALSSPRGRAAAAAAAGAVIVIAGLAVAGPGASPAVSLFLAGGLVAAAAWDAAALRIPDALNAALAVGGISAAGMGAIPGVNLTDSIIGAAVGATALSGVSSLYLRLRGRPGLGLGDAKLFGAIGAWVGWLGLAPTLAWAAAAGLAGVAAARLAGTPVAATTRIAFAPGLALGGWIVWLARNAGA